jgi:hypothetical protein
MIIIIIIITFLCLSLTNLLPIDRILEDYSPDVNFTYTKDKYFLRLIKLDSFSVGEGHPRNPESKYLSFRIKYTASNEGTLITDYFHGQIVKLQLN